MTATVTGNGTFAGLEAGVAVLALTMAIGSAQGLSGGWRSTDDAYR